MAEQNNTKSLSLQSTCRCINDLWHEVMFDAVSTSLSFFFISASLPQMERERKKRVSMCTRTNSCAIRLHEVFGLELNVHKRNYRACMCAHYSLPLTVAWYCQKETDRDREASVNYISPTWESLSGYQTPALCVWVCKTKRKAGKNSYVCIL